MAVGVKNLERTANTTRFVAPNGSSFNFAASNYTFGPWNCTTRVRMQRPYAGAAAGLQLRKLHVAPAGNYETLVTRVLGGTIKQVVAGRGGEFVIADGAPGEQGVAWWRGSWHQVATWLVPGLDVGARALRFFDRLEFLDSPEGLRITTTSGGAEVVEVLDASLVVEGVGFVDVYPATSAVGLVPQWRGTPVSAGEVWSIRAPSPGGTTSYLLATPTAVAIVNPHDDAEPGKSQKAVADFLSSVTDVSWTREA